MRFDCSTGLWREGPRVDVRIRRLLARVSRERTLSADEALAIARKAASKWQRNPGAAANAVAQAGFLYPKGAGALFGYRAGVWLGSRSFEGPGYAEAEVEAIREGRQFVPDFRAAQIRVLTKQSAQAVRLVQDIRRMQRQLSEERNLK